MSTLNIHLLCRRSIDFPELAIFASRSGVMINLHWLELPMARTIFHGPKDVRAIEVRLYSKKGSQLATGLTLKMSRKPASENVVCLCRLLNILENFSNPFLHTGKQCGP